MAGNPNWTKGVSGNPKGRPKKKRAFTQALESTLNRMVTLSDGTRINGKRYLAGLIAEAITEGRITLANGEQIELGTDDIVMFMKYPFAQIDGPPPQEHTGADGGPLRILIEYADSDGNPT